MGTQAVQETRGQVATYRGKPINALYTSTCGGRTENSENIFDFNEPYLRGVECSLEGRRHFEPTLIKTVRLPAKLRDEKNLELVRQMSLFALNGFQLSTAQMSDDWFEEEPTQSEISNWLNQLAVRFGKTFPSVNKETAKPAELARILAQMIYGDAYADTLLSEADVNYQLAFDDAARFHNGLRSHPAFRRKALINLRADGRQQIETLRAELIDIGDGVSARRDRLRLLRFDGRQPEFVRHDAEQIIFQRHDVDDRQSAARIDENLDFPAIRFAV